MTAPNAPSPTGSKADPTGPISIPLEPPIAPPTIPIPMPYVASVATTVPMVVPTGPPAAVMPVPSGSPTTPMPFSTVAPTAVMPVPSGFPTSADMASVAAPAIFEANPTWYGTEVVDPQARPAASTWPAQVANPQPAPPSPLLVSPIQPPPPVVAAGPAGVRPVGGAAFATTLEPGMNAHHPPSSPASGFATTLEPGEGGDGGDQRGSTGWRGRWFSRLLALIVIGISLYIDVEAIFLVPVLFVLVVPFEKMFPRHRQKIRRPHVLTDIGYALAGGFLNVIGIIAAIPVGILSLAWVPGLLIRPLVGMIPAGIMPFVGIALFDLAIYWTHRWYHEVPFLWRFHAIHHSTERLDWVSGFRNHPLDGTLIAPAIFFLLAAGFTAEFTGVVAVIQILTGLFLHANVRWRLRPFHKLVITPEFHHWHHANEPGAINSNYSVFLPAWDLVFGTYFMPADRRPQRYGVSEYIPDGMVAQLRHPLRGMPRIRSIVWASLRHPIRSAKRGWRLLRIHVLAPIRRGGIRRRRPAMPGAARPS